MNDCEESEFFWESWTSPVKRKRKKDSQKDSKNNKTMKTDESIQKKKKRRNSKFKDAMARRKAKKKEKKKKKNRLELDDSLTLTEASSKQTKPTPKPETLNDNVKSDHMTQDCMKKTKRKKKVAFDLSPGYIRVKPKFVSSTPQCPKKSVLSENEGDRDGCSQVTASGQSQGPTQNNDSQCTSEDINSQDLFITQKTFRVSPNELSSGEVVTETPQVFTQQDEQDSSLAQIKRHLDESYKCPQDSHFHQHHRKSDEHEKKPETVQVLLSGEEEEEERSNKEHHEHKKAKYQTQMEFKANFTGKKVLRPVQVKPIFNPYLAEPVVVSPSLDVAKPKKHSCTSSQQSMKSKSTQTENFFSSRLSSYLNFCQKTRVTTYCEDLKPLDLSLPKRARKDLWTCLSLKTSFLPKGHKNKYPNVQCTSCSSGIKDVEVKKAAPDRHSWSVSSQGKGEKTLSPQSESEPKSADTTTSSEDNEPPCRTGKLDLSQVRAVQMRLNESFFFKTKGEGQSPRPQSPLMKLAQSRDVKSRKGH